MTRKEIIKIGAFSLIFLWLLIHVTYCIRMNGEVKDRFVGFYAEKRNTLDAVVVGSSPVYPAFAVPQLYGEHGVAVYPLSSNMQRPAAALYLTREVWKRQHPRLMIYEVRMFTADDASLLGNMAHTREVTDNLRYSVNRLQAIRALVEDPAERKDYYFDMIKYHTNWKTLVLPSQLRTWFYAWPEPLKGHRLLTDVGPAEPRTETDDTGSMPIPPEQEQALTELMDELKAHEQDALFVVVPYLTGPEDRDAKLSYMKELIEGRGYRFLNMNGDAGAEIGLNIDEDYRDYGNHLNAVGAEKMTSWFGEWLCARYDLPDHRGDKRYASWDDAYALWQKEYADALVTIAGHIREKSYYSIPEEE